MRQSSYEKTVRWKSIKMKTGGVFSCMPIFDVQARLETVEKEPLLYESEANAPQVAAGKFIKSKQ